MKPTKMLMIASVTAALLLPAAASPAMAQQGFFTSDGPTTLFGEELGEKGSGGTSLTALGSRVECFGSAYTGHKANSGTSLIQSGSTTATVTPHYNQPNCRETSGVAERRATVTTNGCDFLFHVGAETGEGSHALNSDIVCPEEVEGLHISVFGAGDPTHAERLCTAVVTPQANRAGLAVSTNEASDDLVVSGALQEVHVERSGLCLFDGKGNTTTTAEWDFSLTLLGLNSGGSPTGLTVTD